MSISQRVYKILEENSKEYKLIEAYQNLDKILYFHMLLLTLFDFYDILSYMR